MLAYRVAQHTLCRLVAGIWRLETHGAERMPGGPVVVVANHESLLDPIVLGAAFPRPIRFLAKGEFFTPALAPILRSLGGMPVSRGRGDREAVEAGALWLRRGSAVGVFPQGTVVGGEERPWLRGAARLALATGAPVLPVALVDTEKALRPVHRTVRLVRVRALVGEPIAVEPGPATVAAARSLTEQLREAVDELRRPYGRPLPAFARR